MMRSLALALCGAACRVLPARRQSWAEAMAIELAQVEGDRAALTFAGGCLLAALHERARDLDTRFAAGLWSIAVVTALFAVLQLSCAARGLAVVFGARDGMHDALVRQGASLALMARYDAAQPVVVGCLLALGCAQLAGAWFLSRGQLRRSFVAWCGTLLFAVLTVGIQLSIVWSPDGVPSEFHALLVQAVAVPALLVWFHRRQERSREI